MILDKFKERTLRHLESKGEPRGLYPISRSDLMYMEKCILCGSLSIAPLTEAYLQSQLNFFSTSACVKCLYTFRTISPSYSWFKKCWRMISTKRLEVFNPAVEAIRKQRYEKYHSLLSSYVRKPDVLDIGGGYGTGSQVFRDKGYYVEAVEAEDDKAYFMKEALGIPVYNESIEAVLQSNKRKYGLILFSHCLEHLDDPVFVISRIKNLLDPKVGILYLEIPILWNSVTWSDALYLAHKSNFTEENLSYLLYKSGFEILEKVYFRHTVDEPLDLGLVLRLTRGQAVEKDQILNGKRDVDDIRKLYRQGLPINPGVPSYGVIKYNVPFIEHFYQTLRLDTKRAVKLHDSSEFISFESV